eukprot:1154322-Pelagomonas_calceolata.AAC.12
MQRHKCARPARSQGTDSRTVFKRGSKNMTKSNVRGFVQPRARRPHVEQLLQAGITTGVQIFLTRMQRGRERERERERDLEREKRKEVDRAFEARIKEWERHER